MSPRQHSPAQAGACWAEATVGFVQPLLKEPPVPHSAASGCHFDWHLSDTAVQNIQTGKAASDPPPHGFMVLLPSLTQNSLTLFPAVIRHMSHSSVQLFLLECEGLSGYKLYLAEVEVHVPQSVGPEMKSLNSLWTFPVLTLLLSIPPTKASGSLFSAGKGVLFFLSLKSLPPPQNP